jgi:uncharacterized protein
VTYKIEKRGEKWCVVDAAGAVVPAGEFGSLDEARVHMDARTSVEALVSRYPGWKLEHRPPKWVLIDMLTGAVVFEDFIEEKAQAALANLWTKGRTDAAAKAVRRFDFIDHLDGPKLEANGWLRADALISRTGVQVYRRADGTERREYRPPDEVFHSDALASFAMRPVTDDHPAEGLLDAENATRYQRGSLGETIKRDGEKVRASILVTDAELVKKILDGKRELSCGYTCDLDPTPGEYLGQRYDVVQRNIRGNHVAVVDRGRAGPEVRLRLDSADAVSIRADGTQEPGPGDDRGRQETRQMVKIKVDGIEVEVANEQAAQLITRALADRDSNIDTAKADAKKAREDAATAEKTAKTEAEAQRARADVAEAKVKELDKARTDAAGAFPAAVQARVALESKAREVLGADAKLDGKPDREVKALVISKLSPDLKLDGEGDAYVDAVYRGTLAAASTDAIAKIRQAASGKTDTTEVIDAEKARAKAKADAELEWQKPLGSKQ